MKKPIDYSGRKFNQLLAIYQKSFPNKKNKHRTPYRSYHYCKCDCGKELFVLTQNLIKNQINCGHDRSEKILNAIKTHGMHKEPEYQIYLSMIQRCCNEKSKQYKNYGGRGIGIEKSWLDSFQNFFNDMGKRPHKEYSLDRIDNDKGYSKENCRWANKTVQAFNKRSKKFAGVRKSKNRFYARIKTKGKEIYIGSFKTKEEAAKAYIEYKQKLIEQNL